MVPMAQGAVKHGELDAEALEKLKALIEAIRFANYYDHNQKKKS